MKNSISLFLSGIGSIFGSCVSVFSPRTTIKFNYHKNDVEALKNDWKMVGADIKRSLEKYESGIGKIKKHR